MPIIERLVLESKDVRLVWKFALHPFHDWARGAASAALAAGEQGKFWEMHRLLFEHQDDLREEQARLTGFQADQLKRTLDAIEELREKDPDNPLIHQATFGISGNRDMANEISLMRARLEEMRVGTDIARFNEQMAMNKFTRISSALGFLVDPQLREKAEDITGGELLGIIEKELLESFFETEIPEKPKRRGFFEGLRGAPPSGAGMLPGTTARPSKAKPKASPAKAPEKEKPSMKELLPKLDEFLAGAEGVPGAEGKEDEAITIQEIAPILEKADENNIRRLDIYSGVQRLVEMFPELTRDDVLKAYDMMAEGITVDELIEHLRGKEE